MRNYIKSIILHASHPYNLDIFKENEISLKTFLELDKRFQWVSHYNKFLSSWRKRKNINKSNSNFPVAIIDLDFLKLNLRDFLRFINIYKGEIVTEDLLKKISTEDVQAYLADYKGDEPLEEKKAYIRIPQIENYYLI